VESKHLSDARVGRLNLNSQPFTCLCGGDTVGTPTSFDVIIFRHLFEPRHRPLAPPSAVGSVARFGRTSRDGSTPRRRLNSRLRFCIRATSTSFPSFAIQAKRTRFSPAGPMLLTHTLRSPCSSLRASSVSKASLPQRCLALLSSNSPLSANR